MEYRVIRTADYNNELYHHGVKGMKWGVRKKADLPKSGLRKKYDSAKADYKSAKKAYSKSFDKAYNYSSVPRFTKKGKAERDRRWDDTFDKLDTLDNAKSAYKQVKQERKQQIRNTHREINKQATLKDRFLYNDATRKKAAKYMVDNNMSMADATKKANNVAKRNTAIILGAYGAVTIAQMYAMKRK